MAGFTAGGGSRVDYTGPDEPTDPDQNEVWLDTDADPDGDGTAEGQYKRYGSDGEWHATSVDDHRELKGVLEDNHHQYPIPTAGLVDGAVTAAKAAFDYVTPSQLQDHTSDETNPHNVTDEQTGGAARPVITDTSIMTNGPEFLTPADGSMVVPQDGSVVSSDIVSGADVTTINEVIVDMTLTASVAGYINASLDINGQQVDSVVVEDPSSTLTGSVAIPQTTTLDVTLRADQNNTSDETLDWTNVSVKRELQVKDL
ncbi:hypothetical protein SAMN05216388_1001228 [Halorientalis persicus]|uniref:Uncharacterized protein n=1 Tax=Halorientalis persicus TaxID=1367881 RepID=A0A1H8DA53_9EURY|nr:hypothetical protein [Halorientalis persicus]SEN04231.1 hypothetical protein SAMN05216388_1001228 [Halorientalis persicus]